MDKVQKLIRAGASIPTAVKEALSPMTLTEFADKHGLPRPAVSNAINGNISPSDDLVAALVAELGGDPDDWRQLIWQAAKPKVREIA